MRIELPEQTGSQKENMRKSNRPSRKQARKRENHQRLNRKHAEESVTIMHTQNLNVISFKCSCQKKIMQAVVASSVQ